MRRASTSSTTCLRLQLLPQEPIDDLRVGLALRLAHHLPDEEAEHALLAAAVGRGLARVRGDDRLDHRYELRLVAQRGLREIRVGVDALCRGLRERLVERFA